MWKLKNKGQYGEKLGRYNELGKKSSESHECQRHAWVETHDRVQSRLRGARGGRRNSTLFTAAKKEKQTAVKTYHLNIYEQPTTEIR